jgi:(S)-sulfolactate dehydrogenase
MGAYRFNLIESVGTMAQVVICEFMDQPAVDRLKQKFSVVYDPKLVDQPAELAAAIQSADALIVRNRTQVTPDLLAAGPKLRVVGRLGVGLDNIDLNACADRNVKVLPATGANARAVAEYVIGSAFVLMRGCFSASASVAAGQWPRLEYSNGLELEHRTLGLVGFGFIGRLVAKLALPLGMKVVAFDPALSESDPVFAQHQVSRCASLDSLLQQSDVVSLHVPLTDATRNLIDAATLARMKPDAVLINTARGGVIDESALCDAIRSGRLRGAALDVFAKEPLPANIHPTDMPQLIMTPHIAGLTQEANERVSSLIAERVEHALENPA